MNVYKYLLVFIVQTKSNTVKMKTNIFRNKETNSMKKLEWKEEKEDREVK